MRTLSKKSPQIYLSISEADTKAKVCKKSKTQKCIHRPISNIFTQNNTAIKVKTIKGKYSVLRTYKKSH